CILNLDVYQNTLPIARHSLLYCAKFGDSLRRKIDLPDFGELFRRQRGDDLLETRLASKRIPGRQQFQLAIADFSRVLPRPGKLLAGEIFFANPGGDHRKIEDYATAS